MDTKYFKLAIRILVTFGLLILVLSYVDQQQLRQAVEAARIEYLVILWGASLAFFVLRSFKMRLILKQQALDIGTFTIFKVSAVTLLYSFVLPGFMSSGIKWYILKKATGKGTNIFNGMLYNQLSEFIIMSACALLVLIITNPTPHLFSGTRHLWLLPVICSIILVSLIAVALFLLSSRTSGYIFNIFNYMMKLLPNKMQFKGEQALREVAMLQDAGWRFHVFMCLLTFITQVVGTIIVYIFAAKAANISIPLTVYIWLTSIVFVLGRIPITIANLGVREITLVSILAAYGVEKSSALLMSMIVFSAAVLRAILGAGFMIHWSLTKKG
ncbi:MAG: lysylphosphatidylglycerol synthase transmembrane domain-containing protein [Planctomycetota bacterium]|jgi:uncharacterized membrane protein YbhN (UPF0104 family)